MSTPENTNADTQNQVGSENQNSQIDWEKRYKDTQGAFTKSQQELKAAKAKVEVLEKLTTPQINITPEIQKELDDLKYSDPDAWRVRMNNLDLEAKQNHQSLLSEAEKQATVQAELERRAQLLEEYNRSHPNYPITDEVINFDVPNRILKKLEKGEITFDSFLEEVHNFIYSPKTIGSANETLNQPNLGNIGGSTSPSKGAVDKSIVDNYKNIAY